MQTLPVTTLITDVNSVKEGVERGEEYIVLSRSKPIFKIVKAENTENKKKKKVEMPKLYPIGVPEVIRTRDIYDLKD